MRYPFEARAREMVQGRGEKRDETNRELGQVTLANGHFRRRNAMITTSNRTGARGRVEKMITEKKGTRGGREGE